MQYDEKYWNCHSSEMMMWTKIHNILLQEIHCAYLVIPAPFSKGSSFESISLLVVFFAASVRRINYSVLSVVKGSSLRKSHFLCSWFLLYCWLRILLNTSILVTGYLLHRKFNGSKSRYKGIKASSSFRLGALYVAHHVLSVVLAGSRENERAPSHIQGKNHRTCSKCF